MSELKNTQQCPYCDSQVDDSHAVWEYEETEVECDWCRKSYIVSPQYKFLGFEIEKKCSGCDEKESDCYCDEEEPQP